MSDRIDVVVIGAGQTGLAVSRELRRAGVAHIVLEKGRVAQTWRQLLPGHAELGRSSCPATATTGRTPTVSCRVTRWSLSSSATQRGSRRPCARVSRSRHSSRDRRGASVWRRPLGVTPNFQCPVVQVFAAAVSRRLQVGGQAGGRARQRTQGRVEEPCFDFHQTRSWSPNLRRRPRRSSRRPGETWRSPKVAQRTMKGERKW